MVKITEFSGKKKVLRSANVIVTAFLFFAVTFGLLVAAPFFSSAIADEESGDKVNICHSTSSEQNPWNAIQVDEDALPAHYEHGDFLYEGPVKDNGKPDNDDGQADQWCEENAPEGEVEGDDEEDACPDMEGIQTSEEECDEGEGGGPDPIQYLTIIADKIVCNDESYLPNWGIGGPNVTENTAQDFVEENSPNCWFQEGWQFEWGQENSGNPGDDYTGAAGGLWSVFGPTNENGRAETVVTEVTGSRLELRESLQEGYIPFSYGENGNNNNDYSAELYCHNDVLNYDNYDWIFSPAFDETYYCVAFNAEVEEEPQDACPNMEGIQASEEECEEGEKELCDFDDQSGWYGEYFNYLKTHPDMNLPGNEWPDDGHGDPMGSWDTDWYDEEYFRFSRVDINLEFGENFFPFDADPEEIDNGHDYHFGTHWSAKTNVPNDGEYDFTLTSDDDAWVYIDGSLVAENAGVHPPSTVNFSETLTEGEHIFDIFFAERHVVRSHMYFISQDQLQFMPYNEDCPGDEPEEEICGINKIVNGDFEAPVVTNGAKWDIFPSGTPGLGWLVDWMASVPGSFGDFSRPSPANIELQRGVNGWLSQEGQQHTELDSDWNGPSSGSLNGEPASTTIYQDLATTPGETYRVSFWFSPRPGTGADENELEFDWDSGSYTDTISAVGGSNTIWTQHEYDLEATDSTTRVRFSDMGTPNSLGTFIDNVDVSLLCPEEEKEPGEIEICKMIVDENGDLITGDTPCEPWADEVMSFVQAKRKNGTPVVPERSDPAQALGPAQYNDTINFVSLGFGGQLTLGFDNFALNGPGDDIEIVETSFGNPSDEDYPEKAKVYASQDGSSWVYLGIATLDETMDLGILPWAKFIKLVDVSPIDSSKFPGDADGFDVDGIKALHCGNTEPGTEFTIYGVSGDEVTGPDPVGILPTTTFTTPLNYNSSIIEDNDAECVLYDDLALGGYYYSEEEITPSPDSWLPPLYNDQVNTIIESLEDFFLFSGEFFDADQENDDERNIDADGHIVLTQNRPHRQLVVLNEPNGQEPDFTECSDGQDNDSNNDIDASDPECLDGEDNYNPSIDDEGENNIIEPPQDACPNMEGIQASEEECEEEEPEGPPQNNNGGGSGGEIMSYTGGGQSHPSGEVLGESISEEELLACGLYLLEYIKFGAQNNPTEVTKLQIFLNENMGANIPVTGIYDELTMEWVNKFQLKYREEVLRPWVEAGLHESEEIPTGYVYKTTRRWINVLKCPSLLLPEADLSGDAVSLGFLAGGSGEVLGEALGEGAPEGEVNNLPDSLVQEDGLLETENARGGISWWIIMLAVGGLAVILIAFAVSRRA